MKRKGGPIDRDRSQTKRRNLQLTNTVQARVSVPTPVATDDLVATLHRRDADFRSSPGHLVGVPAKFDARLQYRPSTNPKKRVDVTTTGTFGLKIQGDDWVQAYLDTGGGTTWTDLAQPRGDMGDYLTNIGRVSKQLSGHPSKMLVSQSTRKDEATQQGKKAQRFVATALNEESTGSLSGVPNAGRALLAAAFSEKMRRRLRPDDPHADDLYSQLEQAAPQIKGGGAVELSEMSHRAKQKRLEEHHNEMIRQSYDLAAERFAAKKRTYESIMADVGVVDKQSALRRRLGDYWADTDPSAMSEDSYARRKLQKWTILPGD
jgi:hypothetical protein